MNSKTILLAAAALALLATPSMGKDGNAAISKDRAAVTAASPTSRAKKLREAKQQQAIAVVPTDVRPRRYLTFGDELDANTGRVLTRRPTAFPASDA